MKDFKVRVLASSAAFGTNSFEVSATYDGDPKKFQRDIMTACCSCGYSSILHYDGYWQMVMCWLDNKRMFEHVLELVQTLNYAELVLNNYRKAKKMIKEGRSENEILKSIEETPQLFMKNGKVFFIGGFDESSWIKKIRLLEAPLNEMKKIMEILGMDPEDKEGTRRALANYGFYR